MSVEAEILETGIKVGKERRLGVNGLKRLGIDGTTLVNRLANDVHDAAQSSVADGDFNGRASVKHGLTTDETLSTVHGNGTDSVLTQMLGNLKHEPNVVVLDLKAVQ